MGFGVAVRVGNINDPPGSASPFFNGLALSNSTNDLARLPSGRSLREAKVKVLETAPHDKFLEKDWSEPSKVRQVEKDSERRLPRCQEDSLRNLLQ
jgi:hypothetical protein